jgi:hypothetical protein
VTGRYHPKNTQAVEVQITLTLLATLIRVHIVLIYQLQHDVPNEHHQNYQSLKHTLEEKVSVEKNRELNALLSKLRRGKMNKRVVKKKPSERLLTGFFSAFNERMNYFIIDFLNKLSNLLFVSCAYCAALLAADSAAAAREAASAAALCALCASAEACATEVFNVSTCDCKCVMSSVLAQPTTTIETKAIIDNLTIFFM